MADATINTCWQQAGNLPGIGPIARFDARSNYTGCKKLYVEGGAAVRDELVHRFCNQYPADNLPPRCRCYRFKDTDDYKQYSSLWSDLLQGSKEGVAGDPLAGSFVCFAPACAADPDSYKTSDMQATLTHGGCPDVVYCKQQFGDWKINTKGRSLAEISLEIQQKCGKGANNGETDSPDGNNGDGDDNGGDGNGGAGGGLVTWQVAVAAIAAFVLLAMLLFAARRRT